MQKSENVMKRKTDVKNLTHIKMVLAFLIDHIWLKENYDWFVRCFNGRF